MTFIAIYINAPKYLRSLKTLIIITFELNRKYAKKGKLTLLIDDIKYLYFEFTYSHIMSKVKYNYFKLNIMIPF